MTDFTVIEVSDTLTIDIIEAGGRTLTVEATPTVQLDVNTAGIQGPPGPQGPVGAPGGSRYNHDQAAPAPVWTVQHNLGYQPLFATVIVDGTDVTDGTDIFHVDTDSLTISFSAPTTGRAAFI